MGQVLEHRKHIRFSKQLLMHYSLLERDEFEQTYTRDLSRGAIAFKTWDPVPVSTPLKLKIRNSSFADPIQLAGVVVRSDLRQAEKGFVTVVRLVSTAQDNAYYSFLLSMT